MTRDIDVDLSKVLIQDSASVYMDGLSVEQRLALYHPNDLIEGETGLSDEEREAVDELFGPDRPGFEEAMNRVLGKGARK